MVCVSTFNALTAAPRGVFDPMLATSRMDVKLTQAPAGTQKTFNHVNHDSDETYVIMQGDYSLRVGPQGANTTSIFHARQGDVFTVPKGTPHGDANTQDGYRALLLETPDPSNPLNEWMRRFQRALNPKS